VARLAVNKEVIGAVAHALATDLEFSCPTKFEGEEGWYAIAERALAAASAMSAEAPDPQEA
jgi:hypothetical protein